MAADAEPDDAAARLRFYGALADTELFLLLREEAAGAAIDPAIFALEEGRFAMAFDREDRLAAFADAPAPYAAIPGRALVASLGGRGVGIGLNLGVAPSSALLPADAVDWLADLLAREPDAEGDRPVALRAAGAGGGVLEGAVTGALAGAGVEAWLASGVHADGGQGPVLAVIGAAGRAAPTVERAIARVVNDALAFSGLPAAALDVMFLGPDDPLAAAARGVGIKVADIGREDEPVAPTPVGPGMDPERPPRLR